MQKTNHVFSNELLVFTPLFLQLYLIVIYLYYFNIICTSDLVVYLQKRLFGGEKVLSD